eukprot:3587468-Amphidinium_carterae.1
MACATGHGRLLDEIRRTSFEGVTGFVSLDGNFDRAGDYALYNVMSGLGVHCHYYGDKTVTSGLLVKDYTQIVYRFESAVIVNSGNTLMTEIITSSFSFLRNYLQPQRLPTKRGFALARE